MSDEPENTTEASEGMLDPGPKIVVVNEAR
jgi:hypothetical protein